MIDAQAPVFAFDTLDSTNSEARRRADAGDFGPAWLVARTQSAGRGRRGRSWVNTPGAFLGTYLGHTPLPPAQLARLSLAAGVAVVEALAACDRPGARLKWPNDVFLDGGKVGGILLESSAAGSGGLWFALGIGVNLAALPEGVGQAVASAGGVAPDAFQKALCERLSAGGAALAGGQFETVRAGWLSHAVGLGQTVTATLGADTLRGEFLDLDADGALLMQTPQGIVRITAGDVFFPDMMDE
ncbi:MAG: biotin--[acetyl-CoA-carboxylase] ligase [Caulobacterales bacterium]